MLESRPSARADWDEDDLQDRWPGLHVSGLGDRGMGGMPGQYAFTRRQGFDVRDRPFRQPVESDGRDTRADTGVHSIRLAQWR